MIENLINEEWRAVVGYEGLYEVSNCGRVKALEKTWVSGEWRNIVKHKKETLLSINLSKGYCQVVLTKKGIQKTRRVHRLIMMAFVGYNPEKTIINHKNGIKHDNRLNNLEWCTDSENQIHALKMGLSKPKKEVNILKQEELSAIRWIWNLLA